jgi:hypothetical protein
MPRVNAPTRWTYLVYVAVFLALSMAFVPLSAEARASWVHFAVNMAVRLAIVLAFAAVTSRLLAVDNLMSNFISPAPVEPPEAPEAGLAPIPAKPQPRKPNPYRTPGFWALLALGIAVFLLMLTRMIMASPPIPFTPGAFISLVDDLFYSFCLAFLAICFVLIFLSWFRRPATLTRAERLRRRAINIAVVLFIASACWFYHTPWWDRFLQWGLGIFFWICFLIIWAPRQSSRPELLHIFPSIPPEPGAR